MKISHEWEHARNKLRVSYDIAGAAVIIETEGSHDGANVWMSVRVSRPKFASGIRYILDAGELEQNATESARTFAFRDERDGERKTCRFVAARRMSAVGSWVVYVEMLGNHEGVVCATSLEVDLFALGAGLANIGGLY